MGAARDRQGHQADREAVGEERLNGLRHPHRIAVESLILGTSYLTYDHLGSVRGVYGPAAPGGFELISYHPFGDATTGVGSGTDLRFTGYEPVLMRCQGLPLVQHEPARR